METLEEELSGKFGKSVKKEDVWGDPRKRKFDERDGKMVDLKRARNSWYYLMIRPSDISQSAKAKQYKKPQNNHKKHQNTYPKNAPQK